MRYLDVEKLAAIDIKAFRGTKPYPFINPAGLLTKEGFDRLRATLPDVSQFAPVFGFQRSHGQHPHDRYSLEYRPGKTVLAEPWLEFIAELYRKDYQHFLHRAFNRRFLHLNLHWHYTPAGCSVSPHCDAKRKLGSHIFYFNTEKDWDPTWGGDTLVLEDNGRFPTNSAPAFEDFNRIIGSQTIGNYSFLFARNARSWHGVREIRCPEYTMRKVFIVVVNDPFRYAGRYLAGYLTGKKVGGY